MLVTFCRQVIFVCLYFLFLSRSMRLYVAVSFLAQSTAAVVVVVFVVIVESLLNRRAHVSCVF